MSAQWPTAAATDANLSVAVNSLQTTLSAGIDNVVTTIPLTSTTGFPTTGYITIDNEVIAYTGVSGGNLTGATRGSDGTSAASHLSLAAVSATIVAAHHNSLKDEIKAVETDLFNAISAITPATATSTAATLYARFQHLTNQIKNGFGLTNWYDAVTAMLPLVGGTLTGLLSSTVSGASNNFLAITTATNAQKAYLALFSASNSSQLDISSNRDVVAGVSNKTGQGSVDVNFVSAPSDGHLDVSASSVNNGAPTLAATFSDVGCALKGTTTNNNAAAGYVGEYVSAFASSVAGLTNNTFTNITSISLTAGDWDVCGYGGFSQSTTANSYMASALSAFSGNTTTDTNTGNTVYGPTASGFTSGSGFYGGICVIPRWRVSITTTTTIYVKTYSPTVTGSPLMAGAISARRMR
jgi:hypothetical protein